MMIIRIAPKDTHLKKEKYIPKIKIVQVAKLSTSHIKNLRKFIFPLCICVHICYNIYVQEVRYG